MLSIILSARDARAKFQFERFGGEAKEKLPRAPPKADRERAATERWKLALRYAAPFTIAMFGVATSDDYQPVAWMGRYPIHVPTLLVIVHVTCMILGCFLLALEAEVCSPR